MSNTLGDWLQAEPFTLAMSSGFFGFFAHCGVLKALHNANLLPTRVAGSSAGALITGCWAAGLDPHDLEQELASLQRSDFWDPSPGAGLLKGRKFTQKLRSLLPVHTFEACRVQASISVFDCATRSTMVAQSGDLVSAIQASCTVPLLFHPVRWDGRLTLDGGIYDRPGIDGIPAEDRLFFHHLSSRSPWRKAKSLDASLPSRPNITSLVLEGLPRLGPFRLQQGPKALELAYRTASESLERPIHRQRVQLSV